MNKIALAALVSAIALAAGACGSHSPSTTAHPAVAATTSPTLTNAQGARICHDLSSWWKVAYNEDMPRFDVTMEGDEQQARETQLGDDLSTLDDDLQSENSAALLSGPPGDPGDMQVLTQDCTTYGVTVSQPGN